MNKKGLKLLDVLIAFVIAIILVVLIWRLMGVILPFGEKEDTSINFFNNLVDNVDNLKNGENTSSLFSIEENHVLVSFKRGSGDIILGPTRECFNIETQILFTQFNRPKDCDITKSCLCLCDKELLKKDANACGDRERSYCVEFDYDIVDSENKCGVLFLMGKSTNNLEIERKDDVIDIHKS